VRRVVTGFIGVILAVSLLVLIWPTRTAPRPPALSLLSVEPADGFTDDDGTEMLLVTVSLSNPNASRPENFLYISNSGRGVEARVVNRWVGVGGRLDCGLSPGQKSRWMFVMPAHAGVCRVCVKYAGASLSMAARVRKLLEHIPWRLRSGISPRIWWMGRDFSPTPPWREIHLEIALPPASARPAHDLASARNRAAPDNGAMTVSLHDVGPRRATLEHLR